jgi:hypothetical protein
MRIVAGRWMSCAARRAATYAPQAFSGNRDPMRMHLGEQVASIT